MTTNILAAAAALSDQDLLARLDVLASRERVTSAEVVAHLAALEMRPSAYAAQGYGTLFNYCTRRFASPRTPRTTVRSLLVPAAASPQSSISLPRAR